MDKPSNQLTSSVKRESIKKAMIRRMYERRTELGLSQAKLAKMLGSGQSRVGNWEQGLTTIPYDLVDELADALDCTTSYLLGLSDTPEGGVEHKPLSKGSAIALRPKDLERRGISDENLMEIPVKDDAMYPELKRGCTAVIDGTIKTISNNGIYAIEDDQQGILFRGFRVHIGGGGATVYTINKDMEDKYDITGDEFKSLQSKVVGKYIGRWQWSDEN